MKQISQPEQVRASNAWGRPSNSTMQTFEVESSDIGVKRFHYLGYGYSSHTFGRADVGKHISVSTDGTGWTCWSFTTPQVTP